MGSLHVAVVLCLSAVALWPAATGRVVFGASTSFSTLPPLIHRRTPPCEDNATATCTGTELTLCTPIIVENATLVNLALALETAPCPPDSPLPEMVAVPVNDTTAALYTHRNASAVRRNFTWFNAVRAGDDFGFYSATARLCDRNVALKRGGLGEWLSSGLVVRPVAGTSPCLLLPPVVFDSVTTALNLTCASDSAALPCRVPPGLLLPPLQLDNGAILPLQPLVQSDGALCVLSSGDETSQIVTLGATLLHLGGVRTDHQRRMFGVGQATSEPWRGRVVPAGAVCTPRRDCGPNEVFNPRDNLCVDTVCSRVFFKYYDTTSHQCRNRLAAVVVVFVVLGVIAVSEVAFARFSVLIAEHGRGKVKSE